MQLIHSLLILLIFLLFTPPAIAVDPPQIPVRVGIATIPSSPYSIIIEKMGTGDGTIKQDIDTATKDYNPLLILTAIPDNKSKFIRWEGNIHSSECYSSSTVIRVTLNAIKTCTAIFDRIPALFTITGKIQNNQGIGIANVTIATQTGITTTTDAAGNYTLTNLISGDYLLTASKYAFNFTPPTTTISVNNSPAMAPTILAMEILIDDLPRFTSQVVTKAILGETYRYEIVARDPDASEILTISALEQPTWLNLTTTGNGTAILTGNPPNMPTHYFVNLQVTNTKGKKTTQSYDLLATPRINTPPVFTSTPVTQVLENNLYNYHIAAIDRESSPLTFSTILLPNWLNFKDNNDGTVTLTGSPQHADIGIHLVSVQAQDAAGEYAVHTFNIAVTAQTYSLIINKIGNGSVTSTPAGIACGTTCQFTYPSGTVLNLTVTPDSGFTLNSLSGDCSQPQLVLDKPLNCIVTFTKTETIPNNPNPADPAPINPINTASCDNLKIINTSCNMQGKNLADVIIQSNGMISNGIFSGTVDNQGWVANSTLLYPAKLNGGVVTGYITNLGTMTNFEFRGEELYGGTLGGFINVTRNGVLRDLMLAANTYITGGKLTGEIIGDPDAPATVENVVVTANSRLVNVILGKNVTLESNVTVEKSTVLPRLTDNFGSEWAFSIDNKGSRSRPSAKFSGGIATVDNNYYKINAVSRDQPFQVRASIDVAAEDVGKIADILLVIGFEPPDIYGFFDGGVDTVYTALDSQNRGLPIDLYASAPTWMTQFTEPFKSKVLLQPRLFFNLWQGQLARTGQYYIFLGYRLANGMIIYSPSPLIIQVN
jgi:Carboxypeptidase regulatory-like domain/Divergent InlB B-repeat domain/Putative Ig domain